MRDLERLGDSAQRELSRFEHAPGMVELVSVWPRAVGPDIARNAWPARIARDGTLHVATSSSTWAFELKHLEADVLARLRTLLREGVPKQLRFAPGPLPSAPPEPAQDERAKGPAVRPETRTKADSLVAAIEDEELRELVARAAATSLERAATDRSV